MKVKDIAYDWLVKDHKGLIKVNTYQKYETTIRNYILPYIGDIEISKVNKVIIQDYIYELKNSVSKRTNKPYSASLINSTIVILKMIFDYALDLDYILQNPAKRIKQISTNKQLKVKCFSAKDQIKIENFVRENPDKSYYGLIMCLYTSLRIGELLALRWEDIDLRSRLLYVKKTVIYLKDESGKWIEYIDTPKTKSSIRVIPIPKFMVEELRVMKRNSRSKWVICFPDGKKMNSKLYRYRYNSMIKKLKLEKLNFHALRHTFATRALEVGMDIKTLSEILGHANASITLNVYAHSMMSHKIKQMNLLKPLVRINLEN